MAPLKPGDIIWSKSKPHRKGIINAANSVGGKKHEWIVLFEESGTTETLKSQQLLRRNPNEIVENSATNNAHLPVVEDCPHRHAAAAAPPPPPAAPPSLEESDVSSSHNDEMLTNLADMHLYDDGEEEELLATPTPPAPPSAADESIEDPFLDSDDEDPFPDSDEEDPFPDSDEEAAEEGGTTPPAPPADYVMPTAGATVDMLGEPTEEDYHNHGEIDIEPEDIHKAKWEQYITNKTALLSAGWSITKKSSEGVISIGATVRTKARANRREGVIIDQVEDIEGRKVWRVDFSNGQEDPVEQRPQKLALVERNEEEYVWNLTEDSEPEPGTAAVEYTDGIGLIGFNFPEAFKEPTGAYDYPHLKLLQKMWPGDWKQQLKQMNNKIAADNAIGRFKQKVNQISEQEWWVFVGILISAGPHGKGGKKLWEKPSQSEGFFGMTQPINYGPDGLNIMAYYRFNQIKESFPWSFQDKTKAAEEDAEEGSYDPWNMVLLLVNGYNKNRHDWVAASVRKTLDESMSAFRPRTSKTGGFPNISYILRKPEPLGTEFKVIACAVTGKLADCCVVRAPWSTHFDVQSVSSNQVDLEKL
jgi:hypothetical protein